MNLMKLSCWGVFLMLSCAKGLVTATKAHGPLPLDEKELDSSRPAAFRGLSMTPHIPLSVIQRIVGTEANSGFGGDEAVWKTSIEHAWKHIALSDLNDDVDDESSVKKESLQQDSSGRIRRRNENDPIDHSVQKVLQPLLVCDTSMGKSGEDCVKTIKDFLDTDSVLGLYNRNDMTCVIAMAEADGMFPFESAIGSPKSAYAPQSLQIVPLTVDLKMPHGMAEMIATRANEISRIEAVYCPLNRHKDNEGMQTSAQDIANSLFRNNSKRRRHLFQEAPRGADGRRQWGRFIEESSPNESMESCRAWIPSLDLEAAREVIFWQIPDVKEQETSAFCLQAMLVDLALKPEICAVAAYPGVITNNQLASRIVQGAGASAADTTSEPFYEVGLNGTNQIVALSDTGLDTDNCFFFDENESVAVSRYGDDSNHGHRKVVQYVSYQDDKDVLSGHGTHVAGSIAGHAPGTDGAGNGMAPAAKIAFFDMGKESGLRSPPWSILFSAGYTAANAKIHSISWGYPNPAQYGSSESLMDEFIFDNNDFLVVIAAGNHGRDDDGASTIVSPGLSKNAIAVGASLNAAPHKNSFQNSPDFLADFSSRGPAPDGRIKPDIVAPGMFLLSARAVPHEKQECTETTESGVSFKQGTSMAAPIVAGSAAIVRQYFEEGWWYVGKKDSNRGFNPRASLVKAVLLNGGSDLKGIDRNSRFFPPSYEVEQYDGNQGFGLVNLLESLPLEGKNSISGHFVNAETLHTGGLRTYSLVVDNSDTCDSPLSVTLVWTDPRVGTFCSVSCVLNDLDLTIRQIETDSVFYPNGRNSPDDTNNVERIRLEQPRSGNTYEVVVKGSQLMEAQEFSLVITGCFHSVSSRAPPTAAPSASPTTHQPSTKPSMTPTGTPSAAPTKIPTAVPTGAPISLSPSGAKKPSSLPAGSVAPTCQDFSGDISMGSHGKQSMSHNSHSFSASLASTVVLTILLCYSLL
mmetsp:Transcript_18803/g.38949  ORF Transcript_18803/g.38949 Transcript_18803/m.38949 type:complete len:971 (-) Transcript_18803:482-3394(-)